MIRWLALLLIFIGVAMLVLGLNAVDSASADPALLYTPAEGSIRVLVAGLVMALAGLAVLWSDARKSKRRRNYYWGNSK